MANVNRPFGFKPVGSLSGHDWNGKPRLYAIATDASNTYAIGDVVMKAASADSNGIPYVIKWGGATTTSALPLGVIVGIRVADPGVSLVAGSLDLTKTYLGLSAGTRYVYVVDDPHVVMIAQFDSTAVAATALHQNCTVTVTANQTGLSGSAPLSSTVLTGAATTATLPLSLMGAVQDPKNEVGAYVRCFCKWNYHAFGVIAGASGTVVNYLAP